MIHWSRDGNRLQPCVGWIVFFFLFVVVVFGVVITVIIDDVAVAVFAVDVVIAFSVSS